MDKQAVLELIEKLIKAAKDAGSKKTDEANIRLMEAKTELIEALED